MNNNEINIIEARMISAQKAHDEMTQRINDFIYQLDNVYNQINHSMIIHKNDLGKEHIQIMQEQNELYSNLKNYLEKVLKDELDNNFYNKSGKFFFTQEHVLDIENIKKNILCIKENCQLLACQWKKTSIIIATIGAFIGLIANIIAVLGIFKFFL